MTRARLDELLAKLTPRMAKRFRSVMQRVKSKRTLAQLESALESGQISEVIADVEKAAASVAEGSAAIHTLAGGEVALHLGAKLGEIVSYDGSNPRAVAALARNRLELVQGLSEDARLAIGEALRGGLEGGINPRASAIAIRDSIGLTATQTQFTPRGIQRKLLSQLRLRCGRERSMSQYLSDFVDWLKRKKRRKGTLQVKVLP